MKKLVFVIVLIAFVLVLAVGGNRIAGRTLDAQLAPLLTDVLGLPVTLTPISANLLKLQARSAELVMGPADNPAVVAKDVVVRISREALLEGEIRLEYATGADVYVSPERWPRTGGPLPEDYHFLDPWLPPELSVDAFRLGYNDDKAYPVSDLNWQRHDDGSFQVTWNEQRLAGELQFDNTVQSLYNMLDLAPTVMLSTIILPAAEEGDKPGKIELNTQLRAGDTSSYILTVDAEGPGVRGGRLETAGAEPWSLPETSEIYISRLQVEEALVLGPAFAREGEEIGGDPLARPVPIINYFKHSGHVLVDETRWGDEAGKDTSFDFTMGPEGVDISNLESRGPSGKLTGAMHLVQVDNQWDVKVEASMVALEGLGGIGEQFVDSEWFWETGMTQLTGKGGTWAKLLNSLDGQIDLAGHHLDDVKTPVTFAAQLDQLPGVFGLEDITLTLGQGIFTGSANMTSTTPRLLTVQMSGEQLDLDFLFDDEPQDVEDGIALPEFLNLFPEIEIDATVDVNGLTGPGLNLADAALRLQRTLSGGYFKASATGVDKGDLQVTLDWTLQAEKAEVRLDTRFTELNIVELFKQEGILNSRSTGTLSFSSTGKDVPSVFRAMRGSADISMRIRPDDNWLRDAYEGELLEFSSDAQLVLNSERITGVQLSDLQVTSLRQDLTGDVSFVDGRTPWAMANLRSRQLDINGLLDLLPQSQEEADRRDVLQTLRDLGAIRLTLDVDSLIVGDNPLSKAHLQLDSSENFFDIRHLEFSTRGSDLSSRGTFTWRGDTATLEAEANLDNVNLDRFLINDPNRREIPVSGTAKINSEGVSVADLIANATGFIELNASDDLARETPENRRHFSLVASRLSDGVEAEIKSLQWGESDLAGHVIYRNTEPPNLDIKVDAGTLSLLPWENAFRRADEEEETDAAGRSRGVISRALLAPLRLLDRNTETPPGERIFSSEPIDFSALGNVNATFSGSLDSLVSSVLQAQQVTFDGTLKDSVLDLDLAAGQLNGGNAKITLALDPNTTPAQVEVESTFTGVRGLADDKGYPRSGLISGTSSGNSVADLAAAARGLVFLELGAGPFDYVNTALMTADLASTVFQTLIPGIESQPQQIECGITVALAGDGILATPYGFSIRTNQANLLGRLEMDLVKETLQMTFDSRSRRGVGLSVGNVFSSTVRVIGPLSNPRIAPRATGLAWRGWAAMMTAGLSVVGESVLKRVLASDNPCTSTRRIIERELCPKSERAQSSPMVCPNGGRSGNPPNIDPNF